MPMWMNLELQPEGGNQDIQQNIRRKGSKAISRRRDQIRIFIQDLRLEVIAGNRGASWLELVMAFESRFGGQGWGQQPAEQNGIANRPITKHTLRREYKPTAKQIITEFRTAVILSIS